MMTKAPPIPPENTSPKGPRDSAAEHTGRTLPKTKQVPENLAEQGHQGNIKQNTTNQGYQQNR